MDISMEELLQATIDEGGSDLHIRALMPPKLRVHGELLPLTEEALTEEDSFKLVREMATDEQMAELEKNGGADFALAHPDGTRFRVSIFKERKRYSAVLRQIPNTLLTMAQLGLPPVVKELLFKPRGLILVTGPTGSGKSTTLASMIDVINKERNVHIVTIEDPIEFSRTSLSLAKCATSRRSRRPSPPPKPATSSSAPSTRQARRRPSTESWTPSR